MIGRWSKGDPQIEMNSDLSNSDRKEDFSQMLTRACARTQVNALVRAHARVYMRASARTRSNAGQSFVSIGLPI